MSSRRTFLKGLAAAPLAGKAIAENITGSAMLKSGLGVGTAEIVGEPNPAPVGMKFMSYKSWFDAFGKQRIYEDAELLGWDGDVLSMHLPFATLARIQKQRNREKAAAIWRRRVMAKIARRGFFEAWE